MGGGGSGSNHGGWERGQVAPEGKGAGVGRHFEVVVWDVVGLDGYWCSVSKDMERCRNDGGLYEVLVERWNSKRKILYDSEMEMEWKAKSKPIRLVKEGVCVIVVIDVVMMMMRIEEYGRKGEGIRATFIQTPGPFSFSLLEERVPYITVFPSRSIFRMLHCGFSNTDTMQTHGLTKPRRQPLSPVKCPRTLTAGSPSALRGGALIHLQLPQNTQVA